MQLQQMRQGNLYIVSAYKEGEYEPQNITNHYDFKQRLYAQSVEHRTVEGSFGGQQELSCLLIGTHKMVAHHHACVNRQECFLKLEPHKDGMYRAYVVDTTTGDESFAGYFRSMSYDTIKELRLDYTKQGDTYYTIWSTDTTCMLDVGCEINHELIKRMEKYPGRTA